MSGLNEVYELDVQEWLNHPVTKAKFSVIKEELKAAQDTLTRGAFRYTTCDEFTMEAMKLIGRIQGLNSILELKT